MRKEFFGMSLILWMIGKNRPLGHWLQYKGEYDEIRRGQVGKDPWEMTARERAEAALVARFSNEKECKRTARIIVTALTQRPVGDLVAREWDQFPPQLRMDITNICNTEAPSGNVVKGIQYLDRLLGGRVLRQAQTGPTDRTLRTIGGVLVSQHRRINPAVAGASRAFAAYQRPSNYNSLPKRERRKIDQELAAMRRADKR